jgi:hypothetical protein
MAKKKTKAQHVRELLAKTPNVSYKDAVVALEKKGIQISSAAFYSTRHAMLKQESPQLIRRRRRKPKQRRQAIDVNSDLRLAMLEEQNARLKAVIAALL